MVGGETVYADGRHLTFDYDDLYSRVTRAAEELRAGAEDRKAFAEQMAPHVQAFCTCLAREPFRIDHYGEAAAGSR